MANLFTIVATTKALVDLLTARMPVSYEMPVDVQEAGRADFDDKGQLVLKNVAVRVRFVGTEYSSARDVSGTSVSAALTYGIICRHGSLRGSAETRSRTQALLDMATEELAGARLLLDTLRVGPIEVHNVVGVSDAFGPVEDCYALTIRVPGIAQFDGRNANPQQGAGQ